MTAVDSMESPNPAIDTKSQTSAASDHPHATTAATGSSEHSKEDLWKGAHLIELPDKNITVQWFEEKKHTMFARVLAEEEDASQDREEVTTVGTVLEAMVDETWRRTARAILEQHKHVTPDAYPPAAELLRLGAVWLLNERMYCEGHGAHAHRLRPDESGRAVDWSDYTLRIHAVPERHFAADAVDWGKFCRGLLLNSEVVVRIAGVKPHIPILTEAGGALPDGKDGAIVYEVRACVPWGCFPWINIANRHGLDIFLFVDSLNSLTLF